MNTRPVIMTLLPLRHITHAIMACVFLVAAIVPASAEQRGVWELIKVNGRDYVSVESMKKFYRFTKLTEVGKTVILENRKVEMRLTVDGNECLMNRVKFIFSHKIEKVGAKVYVSRMDLAKLIDPVLRPSFIKKAGDFRTVILDPGHGGKDPGATNSIGNEAVYNLKVAAQIREKLQDKGYRVIMTRTTNKFLSLQQRVDLANAVRENAIFVSIHFNSGGSHARGIETFTLSPPGVAHYGRGVVPSDNKQKTGNQNDSANIALATAVHGTLLRRLEKHTLDRGVKRARFSVLSGVKHPAILLEGGFMTHQVEARLIHNPAYQDSIATGVVEAIAKYRYAVGAKPPTSRP